MPNAYGDQDAHEIELLETVLSVYRAHMAMSTSHNHADWGESNPESLRVVLWVRKLRTENNP